MSEHPNGKENLAPQQELEQELQEARQKLRQSLSELKQMLTLSNLLYAAIPIILVGVLLWAIWPKPLSSVAQVVGPEKGGWLWGPRPREESYYASSYDSALAKRGLEGWRTYTTVTADIKFNRDFVGLVMATFKDESCRDSLIAGRAGKEIINPVILGLPEKETILVRVIDKLRVRVGKFKAGETYRVIIESPMSVENRILFLREIALWEWDGRVFVSEEGAIKQILIWGDKCIDS